MYSPYTNGFRSNEQIFNYIDFKNIISVIVAEQVFNNLECYSINLC